MKEKASNFEKDKEKAMSRRNFLGVLGMSGLSAAVFGFKSKKAEAQEGDPMPSHYEGHGWFYTLEEIKHVYEVEYFGEKLLKNTLKKRGPEFVGTIDGQEFALPQDFINRILNHLKAMLDQKTARYLFRLDAFHGHLFVPKDDFKARYAATTNVIEDAKLMVDDFSLGILYHNTEHLKIDDGDLEAMELHQRRNVVGFIDGRPIQILPLPRGTKATGVSEVPGTRNILPYLRFAAHKDGLFSVTHNGREIKLDISFDDQSYY